MSWKRLLGSIELQVFVLVLAAAAPVLLPALNAFFTFDDLMNLNYYAERPWKSVYSNLLVFTSLRRPLGALFYLPFYYLWGMNPFPLYLTLLLLVALNLGLLYSLALRLTASLATAMLAAALVALHPYMHTIIFNFGTVYELTALAGILGGLHCYVSLSTRPDGDPKRKWWYAATWLCYWVSLNAKESGVVLPALLLAYEFFYRFWRPSPRPGLKSLALRLGPMFAVAGVYTLSKVLGQEAHWRTNPMYAYHFDFQIIQHLADYATLISYRAVTFDVLGTILLLAGLTVSGLLLRNRHILFGLTTSLICFLPMLALPRIWSVFLYIPSAGLSLCLSALIADSTSRLARWITPRGWQLWRPGRLLRLAAIVIVLGTILGINEHHFRHEREQLAKVRTIPWRSFAEQILERIPDSLEATVVGIEDPPYKFSTTERWIPVFLVKLGYPNRPIRVFLLPHQENEFQQAASTAPRSLLFKWDEGKLVESKP